MVEQIMENIQVLDTIEDYSVTAKNELSVDNIKQSYFGLKPYFWVCFFGFFIFLCKGNLQYDTACIKVLV